MLGWFLIQRSVWGPNRMLPTSPSLFISEKFRLWTHTTAWQAEPLVCYTISQNSAHKRSSEKCKYRSRIRTLVQWRRRGVSNYSQGQVRDLILCRKAELVRIIRLFSAPFPTSLPSVFVYWAPCCYAFEYFFNRLFGIPHWNTNSIRLRSWTLFPEVFLLLCLVPIRKVLTVFWELEPEAVSMEWRKADFARHLKGFMQWF